MINYEQIQAVRLRQSLRDVMTGLNRPILHLTLVLSPYNFHNRHNLFSNFSIQGLATSTLLEISRPWRTRSETPKLGLEDWKTLLYILNSPIHTRHSAPHSTVNPPRTRLHITNLSFFLTSRSKLYIFHSTRQPQSTLQTPQFALHTPRRAFCILYFTAYGFNIYDVLQQSRK